MGYLPTFYSRSLRTPNASDAYSCRAGAYTYEHFDWLGDLLVVGPAVNKGLQLADEQIMCLVQFGDAEEHNVNVVGAQCSRLVRLQQVTKRRHQLQNNRN